MSPSSTSSSKEERAAWRRLGWGIALVLALLLLLELIFRLPAVQAALKPYETLLWYDRLLPEYERQLRADPNYTVWLGGSSYMMTALDPAIVAEEMRAAGVMDATAQNFGMTLLRDFEVMAEMYDRWLLELDQPEYMVIAISEPNFWGRGDLPVLTSPMERMVIFRETFDDHLAAFLWENSALFHYGILLRNAAFVPREAAALTPQPQGGYTWSDIELDCPDDYHWGETAVQPHEQLRLENGLRRLDAFLDVFAVRGIPVLVINLPLPSCVLAPLYGDLSAYNAFFLDPVAVHLAGRGVPVVDLNAPFHRAVPPAVQHRYFRDPRHPNRRGAQWLSAQVGGAIVDRIGD